MAMTIPPCSMRWSVGRTACAVSRWRTPTLRRPVCAPGIASGSGDCASTISSAGQLHYRGGAPLSAAHALAPLMAELGWHLQLWIDVKDLPETVPVLKSLGLPVVIDHMGRTDARAGTATTGFQSLLRAVGDGWCWAKLSGAHRLSRAAPDYPDARPFHEALVKANPERLVWGGDWPHPRVEGEMPDAGHLFELFQQWTPNLPTQHRILVTNPAKLHDFPN